MRLSPFHVFCLAFLAHCLVAAIPILRPGPAQVGDGIPQSDVDRVDAPLLADDTDSLVYLYGRTGPPAPPPPHHAHNGVLAPIAHQPHHGQPTPTLHASSPLPTRGGKSAAPPASQKVKTRGGKSAPPASDAGPSSAAAGGPAAENANDKYHLALHRSKIGTSEEHWSLHAHPADPSSTDKRWKIAHAHLTQGQKGDKVMARVENGPGDYNHGIQTPTSEHHILGEFQNHDAAHAAIRHLSNQIPIKKGYPEFNCVDWSHEAMKKLAGEHAHLQPGLATVTQLVQTHGATVRENTKDRLQVAQAVDTTKSKSEGKRPGRGGGR